MKNVKVRKKDGTLERYDPEKIKAAIGKSAARINYKFSDETLEDILACVAEQAEQEGAEIIDVGLMHSFVEGALEEYAPKVCKSYREYRNYKTEFVYMLDEVYKRSQSIMYIGDKENSNMDSTLVSTKRSLIFNELNKELYKKFFLTREELQAVNDGFIYIHDMSARRDTMNCCLFDVASVLSGGFEMGNIWYNEPKTLDTAFDVIGDIVLSAAAQQYGGFTMPEVDKILEPYAEKSYKKSYEKYMEMFQSVGSSGKDAERLAEAEAMKDVQREFEQGYQGWEYKFNTVGSSRGDYPFIAITFGLGTGKFEKMCSKTILNVHKDGQGKAGAKRPVLFPKLIFLYDKEIHGEGGINRDVYDAAIKCSSVAMYPDWLSLTGEGYVSEIYKK